MQWNYLTHDKYGQPKKRTRNLGAQKVTIDGIVFDSTLEGAYYLALRDREMDGEITELSCHKSVRLYGSDGSFICKMEPDFCYKIVATGELIYADTKGLIGDTFKLKAKVFRACSGYKIEVIKKNDFHSAYYDFAVAIRETLGNTYKTDRRTIAAQKVRNVVNTKQDAKPKRRRTKK